MASVESKDAVEASILEPATKFVQEARDLLKDCKNPQQQDYLKTAMITGIGFIALGVAGYLIKLVHIPINNLLVGGGSA